MTVNSYTVKKERKEKTLFFSFFFFKSDGELNHLSVFVLSSSWKHDSWPQRMDTVRPPDLAIKQAHVHDKNMSDAGMIGPIIS